ncbi:MAG TPA: ABC transporter permease [Bryobacteraceae bacterium]|jgi:predicted permease|nr:ABC transporter permease [Bryobacteraceae bacterium]
MRGLLVDLGYSLRLARKSPGFTFLAVACLALGIGVNTSVFSMLNFLFFRPLPVAAPDRLVVLRRDSNQLISWPDYRDLRDRTQLLAGMAASNPTESSLDFDGETHTAAAEAVSLNYSQVIGVRPLLGRWFERDDERVAVIGYHTWQRLFHADPHILGKRVRSETQWYTVVGVAPPEFAGIYLPLNMDIWVPFGTWAAQYPGLATELEDRARPRVFVFGRMKPGVAPPQAAAELNAIAAQIRRQQPQSQTNSAPIIVERVRGVPNTRSRSASTPIAAVLMAVVGIILLIACVNVGNLLLARGAAREREISLRIALGARRARVVRQLLTENLTLAAGGGLGGLVLGFWTGRLLEVLLPTTAFGEALRLDFTPDARVAASSALLALLTTIVFGLAPAWRASRTDVLPALKGEAHGAARFGLRRFSLVAQVSLSLVLLLTAGLFLRVLLAFQIADPGFAVKNRIYITTLASAPEFTPETGRQFYAQTLDRLRALPGVKNAAVTNLLPLTPINPGCASASGRDAVPATTSTVSPGYLRTMRIALANGRDFSAADLPGGQPVAIVNETLAQRLWPGEPSIGKRLLLGCHDPSPLQVVGVARDARLESLGEAPKPHVYRAFAQDSGGIQNILLETASDAGSVIETVHKTVTASPAGARIYGVRPLSDWVDRSYWQVRWEVCLLGAFGGLALLLAGIGLYGAVAYHVTLRTREIGIRMAVGAQPADVLRMVLRQGLGLTLAGVGIGLAASAGIARTMARLLYGVSPTDVATYAAVSLLWLAVACAACYWPARRAARVEPTIALRYE